MKNDYKHITELVSRIRMQDEDAFTELYNYMYQRVYFMAFSIVKDEYLAQDVVQETFINVYNNVKKLERDMSFIAWINRIAYHCSLKLLVKNETVSISHESAEWGKQGAAIDNHEPLEPILSKEKAQTIMRYILELSPEYRIVILLKYYEDMKVKEIADCLECSVGTVKSRLNRGKAVLRKQMSGRGILEMVLMSSGIGLGCSITSYAKDIARSKSAAGSILESGIAALGNRSAITSCSSAFHIAPLLAKNGIIVVSAIVFAAAGVMAVGEPDVTIVYPSDAYTNESVSVLINVESYLPVKSFQIKGAGGKEVKCWSNEKGIYETKIYQNGQYQAEAILLNGKRTKRVFEIGTIDHGLPELEWYRCDTEKDVLHCRISDSQSGVDYARIYKETSDGTIQKPLSYQADSGEIEFSLSDQTFFIYLYDRSGNFVKYQIEQFEDWH